MDQRTQIKRLEKSSGLLLTIALIYLNRRNSWWRRLLRWDRLSFGEREFEQARDDVKANVTVGVTVKGHSVVVRRVAP